jgi:hypothetical protein
MGMTDDNHGGRMLTPTSYGRRRSLRRVLRVLGRVLSAIMIGGATLGLPKVSPEAPPPQTTARVDQAP